MALPALQTVVTGVNLSASTISRTVTQGQNAVYSIAINRRNFSGSVNLSISGVPAGVNASFSPASTTGNTSTLTITTNSATATGTFTPSITATASGISIFPLSLNLTINPLCAYSISPAGRNFDSSGGSGSITVSTASGCAWIAKPSDSWVTINSGNSGNGGGTINYTVAANSLDARTGRISVANQAFVITQSGNNPAPGNWIPANRMRVSRDYYSPYSVTLLQNGKVLVAGGQVLGASTKLASAELYDPSTGTWSETGSLNTARDGHRAVPLQNGKVLVVGGYVGSPESPTQTAEIYDPATGTWTNTGSMGMIHSGCSATLLPNGKVLIAGGEDQSGVVLKAELYDPTAGTFSATGDMQFATEFHQAVLMQNGKVLTVGGRNSNFSVTTKAQLFDSASGTWSNANGMGATRIFHTATLLASGKVLVAGGADNNEIASKRAELYDPLSGNWSQVLPMHDARDSFTATLLQNGKVLVAGGNSNFANSSSAEIFDPATGRWSRTANMSVGRVSHSAVRLPNGTVFVVGGASRDDPSTEIFDPGFTGNWSLTGSMITARWDHTATRLNNGRVLVVGGNGPNGILSSAELYDYTTGLWVAAGGLAVGRRNHTATLLTNGKVLVVGGNNGLLTLRSAELYDPNNGIWTTTGDMLLPRASHTATLLPDGRVLVTGGNSPIAPTSTAEIYDPASGLWSSAPNMIQPRSAHTGTLLPSGIVLVAGGNDGSFPTGESFNSATGQWTAFFSFSARSSHTATLLFNGSVLISGGLGREFSSEVFTQGSPFTNEAGMRAHHFFHAAALLPNGRVLLAGGDEGGFPGTQVSEVYDRQSNSWSRTTDLIAGREFHTATLLPNGKVLVAGGMGSAGALSSAELYDAYPGCSFSLNQSSQNFTSGGGSGSVTVTAGTGCLWSAASNASFITITSEANGTGNGTVGFSVEPSNLSNSRTGTITIGDQTFTITQAGGVVTIQFSAANFNVTEGDAATVTVTRSGDTSGTSSVDFITGNNNFAACNVFNGNALANCDFTVASGKLTFNPGEANKTVFVLTTDDAYVEGNETFPITLSNAVGATLASPSGATVTILENDTASTPSVPRKQFVATLTGAQEVPATGNTIKGNSGVVKLSADETSASVSLVFGGLTGNETGAHIHGPAPAGTNANILFPLPLGSSVINFQISPTTQQVADLKAGLHYMNVHSANFQNGEIRGQLLWNPIEETTLFVTQQYYDFQSRGPDPDGLAYWTVQINQCGSDVLCLRNRRIAVSDAFFFEPEFQQTAGYVYRLYRAAYGDNQPFPNPIPDPRYPNEEKKLPSYAVFAQDRAQVVGGANLAQSQLALANDFVQRPKFLERYPANLTGPQFVDAVLATLQSSFFCGASSGADLSSQRDALIAQFNLGGRGMVMYRLADNNMSNPTNNRAFIDAEYNALFVLNEYFSYLRRDPDIGGFHFWLCDQVNRFPLRDIAIQHAMVCSFITSVEYQQRFSPMVTHTNGECPQ
jgi:hypothetical protein